MTSWMHAAHLCNILWITSASIAGVTYMDNFDFEERYQNINECNPLHWHPLHLPDHCLDIFESALTRLKPSVPIQLLKERKGEVIELSEPSPYDISSYKAEVFQDPIIAEISSYGHPFQKMLKLLSKDVEHQPRAPTIGFLPNVGFVALYQQPISRKSEKMILKVANAYKPDVQYNDPTYFSFYSGIPLPQLETSEQKDVVKITKSKPNERPRFIKKKIDKGNAVAIMKKVFK